MRDGISNINPKPVIAPQVATDNTALVGAIIDGAGYESVTYMIQTGTLADADATFVVLLEDGDESDLSDNAAVADAYLIGTEALAGFAFSDDGECRKLGYKGLKRYTRLTVTPANNTGNAPVSAMCVLGHPLSGPQANPPA
ncbi:MAG: hypothetical protein IPH07_24700 [Deltaproteobacteria bacterium]|nr:hypothetical protein [Deltaproteobacteria bacterium]